MFCPVEGAGRGWPSSLTFTLYNPDVDSDVANPALRFCFSKRNMSSRCTWSFRPFLLRSCFVTSCRGQRRAVGSIAGVLRSTGSCGSGGGGASPRRRNRPNAPSVRHGTVPAVAAPIRTRRTGLGRPAPRRPRRPSPSQSPPSARPHRKRAVKPAAKGALIAARRAPVLRRGPARGRQPSWMRPPSGRLLGTVSTTECAVRAVLHSDAPFAATTGRDGPHASPRRPRPLCASGSRGPCSGLGRGGRPRRAASACPLQRTRSVGATPRTAALLTLIDRSRVAVRRAAERRLEPRVERTLPKKRSPPIDLGALPCTW